MKNKKMSKMGRHQQKGRVRRCAKVGQLGSADRILDFFQMKP